MLASIPLVARSLRQYGALGGSDLTDNIEKLAACIRGARVLHLSPPLSQPVLSNTVESIASLMLSVGVEAEWRVVLPEGQRGEVDRALNRALDGQFIEWTADMSDLWLGHSKELARLSLREYDFVVVHGVELAGVIAGLKTAKELAATKWVWQCHADLSKLQPDIHDFLMLYTHAYDDRMGCGCDSWDTGSRGAYSVMPLSVDPMSPGNRDVPQAFVESVQAQHGLDPRRPVVMIVSRGQQIDRRAVDGFRFAKARVPELQLIVFLVDEPNDTLPTLHASHLGLHTIGQDPERVVLGGYQVGSLEANVLQRGALTVLASSDGEAPMQTVLDAMWKGRPAIVGEETASCLGIRDGRNGYVAGTAEEYGHQLLRLLESPLMAASVGEAGREHVRKGFLVTRLLQTYLATFCALARKEPLGGRPVQSTCCAPVSLVQVDTYRPTLQI